MGYLFCAYSIVHSLIVGFSKLDEKRERERERERERKEVEGKEERREREWMSPLVGSH